MILQHFNLGFPLADSTTQLILPAHTTVPRDDAPRDEADTDPRDRDDSERRERWASSTSV